MNKASVFAEDAIGSCLPPSTPDTQRKKATLLSVLDILSGYNMRQGFICRQARQEQQFRLMCSVSPAA